MRFFKHIVALVFLSCFFTPVVNADVGGTVTGFTTTTIVCRNLTTGQNVTISPGLLAWSCDRAGLRVSPEDIVSIEVQGRAFSAPPTIVFTHVPPYGSQEDLMGQVNVSSTAYNVAVYIRVREGWWTKPYWNSPLTPITADGSWVCDITTGGVDPEATMITAYLVPAAYTPPLMSGGSTLPSELETNSVAKATVSRTPPQ